MTKKENENIINEISKNQIKECRIDIDEDEEDKKIIIDIDNIFINKNKNEGDVKQEIEEIKKDWIFLTRKFVQEYFK